MDLLQSVSTEEGRVKKLISVYDDAYKSIEAKLESYREKQARGEITSQFEEFRLNQLQTEIDSEVKALYSSVESEISTGFSVNYERTYYYQSYAVERYVNLEMPGVGGVGYNLNTPVLNTSAVNAAFSEKIAGLTISDRMGQARQALQWKMREMTSRVIAQGQTVQSLAKEFQALYDQIEYSKSRGIIAARTEMLRAYSIGNDQARIAAEEAGVEFDFLWSAGADKKTRPDHRSMDRKKAKIVDGQPVFTLPDGSKASSPRVPAHDSEGRQVGNLAAAESIQCRCRRLDLPFGIAPTERVAKLENGEYERTRGDMTAEEWYQQNYASK